MGESWSPNNISYASWISNGVLTHLISEGCPNLIRFRLLGTSENVTTSLIVSRLIHVRQVIISSRDFTDKFALVFTSVACFHNATMCWVNILVDQREETTAWREYNLIRVLIVESPSIFYRETLAFLFDLKYLRVEDHSAHLTSYIKFNPNNYVKVG